VRKVFGNEPRKDLAIPTFIDDYNHFMGGVDIADQLRAYYSTQRIALRSWYPLFFWLLDTAILNAYLIGKQLYSDNYIQHKEFRMDLWTSLFSYSAQVSSKRKLTKFYPLITTPTLYTFKTESPINVDSSHLMEEQIEIPGVRILEKAEAIKQVERVEHKWKMLGKRVYCYNCRAIYSAKRKRKFGDEISINGVQRKRAGQTLWGCNICDVALCTSGDCWVEYHRRKYSN
jgi:hypothetical protein